jgi:hypothetical protein
MTHGLKSLAQQLPQYGRYNDDMVAHISSDEARLLKSLGGSGTINPTTGLPEFGMFGIGGGGGILGTGINKGASDPVSNALSNNPISKTVSNAVQSGAGAIDKGLVSLDKTVGNVIPGGWGTVAQVAGSMMGLPTPVMVGMGALTGSGVMRKGGNFNLQGAIMGGAMAYGASELGEYARGASDGAVSAVEKVAEEGAKNLGSSVGASGINAATGELGSGLVGNASSMLVDPSTLTSANTAALNSLSAPLEAGFGSGLQVAPPPSIGSQIMSGNFGDAISQAGSNISQGVSNLGTNISEGVSNVGTKLGNAYDAATNPDTYTQFAADRAKDTGDTFSGIKNLMGAGDMTAKEAGQLASASAKAAGTMSPGMAAGMTAYAGMGLAALDQQRQYLKDQATSGAISNAQYQEELAKIEAQAGEARKVVAANPLQVNPGVAGLSEEPTLYARENSSKTLYDKNPYGGTTLYAMGGAVSNPPDDQTGMANRSPMQNLDQGGLMSMVNRTVPQQTFAAGGMPRFLSGGGDGMSDSIKASINGSQEARLADGEFVIPADVVSHIGNGSSKAGAKQLYSMMDRVRQARVGTKKQGKQINPRKLMAA